VSQSVQEDKLKKVLASSLIGSVVEWYDFYLYGTAAALVFNKLFFPKFDPLVGTLLALSTFAIGFVFRPIMGTILGNLGDKIGRAKILMFTLVLMGLTTTAIGLLPTYDEIGIWAPLLLIVLRILQASGAGAEYGGAVLLAAEYAPKEKRGLYSAVPYMGVSLGLLLSTGVVSATQYLTGDQFSVWGWRIPFLVSIIVVLIGYLIRRANIETPLFTETKTTAKKQPRMPMAEVFRTSRNKLFMAWGLCVSDFVLVYLFQTFMVVYVKESLGLSGTIILNALILSAVCQLITIPAFGALSDRIGRRTVILAGAAASALFAFPFFMLVNTKSPLLILVAILFANAIARGAIVAVQASWLCELFETSVRYSGIAIGREWPSVVGGIAPVIATGLLIQFGGSWWPIALLISVLSIIAFIAVYVSPEMSGKSLKEIGQLPLPESQDTNVPSVSK
jgi:MFS family permease